MFHIKALFFRVISNIKKMIFLKVTLNLINGYFRQFSLIVPYLSALVPLAEVAHIPQIEAFAPGSTGNQRPEINRK